MRFSSLAKPARWPGRRRHPATRRFIFLYHRIASPQDDPFALAVSESWFHEHLDILKSHCRLVTLDEILATQAADSAIMASITFDDGYTDNLSTASPILQHAGIPATFFICTGCLGDARGFWWDRLASTISVANARSPQADAIKGFSVPWNLSDPEARRKTTLEIAPHLQRMRPAARDRLVADLENALLGDRIGDPEPCPVLDEAGLRELGSRPLSALAAHTENHAMLSILTREEQFAEINRSVIKLQAITGPRPRFVAYPYGSQQDYNSDSWLAAQDVQLEAGFVNHPGRFDPVGEPYRIPRYYVPPLAADPFRKWLRGILRA